MNNEFILKKGPNKEIAYKLTKYKKDANGAIDCYLMADANNKTKSISWNKDDGLKVVNEKAETMFYIPKCNPNSKNEPALAFPNIYILEEINIKLRNVIAIEMSQLE